MSIVNVVLVQEHAIPHLAVTTSTIFNQRGSVAIPIDVLKLLLEEAGYTLGKPWP